MRLIDADELRADCNIFDAWDAQIVKAWLDDQPTVDAVKVKHGRWKTKIIHDTFCFQCSACNSIYKGDTHYCPHCGAKMDGGANDDT